MPLKRSRSLAVTEMESSGNGKSSSSREAVAVSSGKQAADEDGSNYWEDMDFVIALPRAHYSRTNHEFESISSGKKQYPLPDLGRIRGKGRRNSEGSSYDKKQKQSGEDGGKHGAFITSIDGSHNKDGVVITGVSGSGVKSSCHDQHSEVMPELENNSQKTANSNQEIANSSQKIPRPTCSIDSKDSLLSGSNGSDHRSSYHDLYSEVRSKVENNSQKTASNSQKTASNSQRTANSSQKIPRPTCSNDSKDSLLSGFSGSDLKSSYYDLYSEVRPKLESDGQKIASSSQKTGNSSQKIPRPTCSNDNKDGSFNSFSGSDHKSSYYDQYSEVRPKVENDSQKTASNSQNIENCGQKIPLPTCSNNKDGSFNGLSGNDRKSSYYDLYSEVRPKVENDRQKIASSCQKIANSSQKIPRPTCSNNKDGSFNAFSGSDGRSSYYDLYSDVRPKLENNCQKIASNSQKTANNSEKIGSSSQKPSTTSISNNKDGVLITGISGSGPKSLSYDMYSDEWPEVEKISSSSQKISSSSSKVARRSSSQKVPNSSSKSSSAKGSSETNIPGSRHGALSSSSSNAKSTDNSRSSRSSRQGQQETARSPSSSKRSSREVHLKALGELQQAASRLPHPEVVYGAMIPEPDYSDDERESQQQPSVAAIVARNNTVNAIPPINKEDEKAGSDNSRLDENGLIMPKKLVNPCLESSDKKNLHRELLFNQKRGVNVLNQKTELQKAMEKHKDKKILKEQQMEKVANMTPFQKALDERAQKIEQMEKAEGKDTENEKSTCEFQKIHAKVRAKMEVQ